MSQILPISKIRVNRINWLIRFEADFDQIEGWQNRQIVNLVVLLDVKKSLEKNKVKLLTCYKPCFIGSSAQAMEAGTYVVWDLTFVEQVNKLLFVFRFSKLLNIFFKCLKHPTLPMSESQTQQTK